MQSIVNASAGPASTGLKPTEPPMPPLSTLDRLLKLLQERFGCDPIAQSKIYTISGLAARLARNPKMKLKPFKALVGSIRHEFGARDLTTLAKYLHVKGKDPVWDQLNPCFVPTGYSQASVSSVHNAKKVRLNHLRLGRMDYFNPRAGIESFMGAEITYRVSNKKVIVIRGYTKHVLPTISPEVDRKRAEVISELESHGAFVKYGEKFVRLFVECLTPAKIMGLYCKTVEELDQAFEAFKSLRDRPTPEIPSSCTRSNPQHMQHLLLAALCSERKDVKVAVGIGIRLSGYTDLLRRTVPPHRLPDFETILQLASDCPIEEQELTWEQKVALVTGMPRDAQTISERLAQEADSEQFNKESSSFRRLLLFLRYPWGRSRTLIPFNQQTARA